MIRYHGGPITPEDAARATWRMDPRVFSVIPYSSVDSTAVARAIGIDSKWTGSYIAHHTASRRWPGIAGIQQNWELFG